MIALRLSVQLVLSERWHAGRNQSEPSTQPSTDALRNGLHSRQRLSNTQPQAGHLHIMLIIFHRTAEPLAPLALCHYCAWPSATYRAFYPHACVRMYAAYNKHKEIRKLACRTRTRRLGSRRSEHTARPLLQRSRYTYDASPTLLLSEGVTQQNWQLLCCSFLRTMQTRDAKRYTCLKCRLLCRFTENSLLNPRRLRLAQDGACRSSPCARYLGCSD